MKTPITNKRIFWDVEVDKLDFEGNADFIICRIIERGDVEDIRNCRKFYNEAKITQALLNTRFLSERKLYLAAAITGHEITEFRCYKNRQSNPELFPY